ncbi:TIGR03557 family F420-dependent LLM class oxidoreductase [Egicoccus sp. AB-alg2]|uniref:TIGR03557 family F420-dependent LLM class oxidoreductase n=1 Tax=Egicoccus sp. AB-alg2 TaxID=3242693 RepID=UPI00359ED1A1
MANYGFTLFSELNGPKEMVEQAVAAERAGGVDFLGMSDHFHPWLSRHTDSPFAWTALGAVATATERLEMVTLVTCPFLRYHPAIIAQAAATVQILADGRFTLGLGAGENLSEHIVGRGWPPVDVRHEMFAEAVEIIRELWTGEWVTYHGQHLTAQDAKLHTLPEQAPRIALAASGPQSIELAVEHGDDIVCDSPEPDVVEGFKAQKPEGRAYAQIPVAYDEDFDTALDAAHHFAFGATGWKVMAELPNIPGFDATAALVDDDAIQELVVTGSDPKPLVDKLQQAVETGYDHIAVVQVGPERTDRFQDWFTQKVRPELP